MDISGNSSSAQQQQVSSNNQANNTNSLQVQPSSTSSSTSTNSKAVENSKRVMEPNVQDPTRSKKARFLNAAGSTYETTDALHPDNLTQPTYQLNSSDDQSQMISSISSDFKNLEGLEDQESLTQTSSNVLNDLEKYLAIEVNQEQVGNYQQAATDSGDSNRLAHYFNFSAPTTAPTQTLTSNSATAEQPANVMPEDSAETAPPFNFSLTLPPNQVHSFQDTLTGIASQNLTGSVPAFLSQTTSSSPQSDTSSTTSDVEVGNANTPADILQQSRDNETISLGTIGMVGARLMKNVITPILTTLAGDIQNSINTQLYGENTSTDGSLEVSTMQEFDQSMLQDQIAEDNTLNTLKNQQVESKRHFDQFINEATTTNSSTSAKKSNSPLVEKPLQKGFPSLIGENQPPQKVQTSPRPEDITLPSGVIADTVDRPSKSLTSEKKSSPSLTSTLKEIQTSTQAVAPSQNLPPVEKTATSVPTSNYLGEKKESPQKANSMTGTTGVTGTPSEKVSPTSVDNPTITLEAVNNLAVDTSMSILENSGFGPEAANEVVNLQTEMAKSFQGAAAILSEINAARRRYGIAG